MDRMHKTNFLNSLATTPSLHNLGAGIPPLYLYPEFSPVSLLGVDAISHDDISINYHQSAGFIRETAAKILEVNESIHWNSERIAITNGVQEAIAIIVSIFKDKELFCLDPSYPGFEESANLFGKKVSKLHPTNWQKELEEIPAGSLIYLSSDFSNPTGQSLTLDQRVKLSELAESNNFFIFDDATYRPFNLEEKVAPLISFNSNKVIHAISFSKILSPGLRIAFIYLPDSLMEAFEANKSKLSLNTSGISQRIVQNWLLRQEYSICGHLEVLKNRLRKNQAILYSHGIKFNGGFFCILNMEVKSDFEFCSRLLEEHEIAVIPMQLFSDNKNYYNKLRLCVANIDSDELNSAIEIIKSFRI